MDRMRKMLRSQRPYQPIGEDQDGRVTSENVSQDEIGKETPFSQVEYWIFLLLGLAMLWSWNMFLAAAPYFQHRFTSDPWILAHFQSAEISVGTVTMLCYMLALLRLQKGASYPFRISLALCIYIATSMLLALSTLITASPRVYFGFLMLMVFCSSLATGLIQNGVFAYVSGFGRSEYTQGIMTGQAVAGVLPCLAQIASVLAVPKHGELHIGSTPTEPSKSAFVFFSTATGVSVVSLVAFFYLLRRRSMSTPSLIRSLPHLEQEDFTETQLLADSLPESDTYHAPYSSSSPSSPKPAMVRERKSIGLIHLFLKLPSLSSAIFLCFAITMVFPVFTATIQSIQPDRFPAALFIPLAFLVWNVGDLVGRLLTLCRLISLTHSPLALVCLSVGRVVFIPLYLLCNVGGDGALVHSDLFYLALVQFGFGLSNGYLGSSCMMGAADWVADEEKAAAGAFMGLAINAGLAVGSLLSFLVV